MNTEIFSNVDLYLNAILYTAIFALLLLPTITSIIVKTSKTLIISLINIIILGFSYSYHTFDCLGNEVYHIASNQKIYLTSLDFFIYTGAFSLYLLIIFLPSLISLYIKHKKRMMVILINTIIFASIFAYMSINEMGSYAEFVRIHLTSSLVVPVMTFALTFYALASKSENK